jgi:hypothetical protein
MEFTNDPDMKQESPDIMVKKKKMLLIDEQLSDV